MAVNALTGEGRKVGMTTWDGVHFTSTLTDEEARDAASKSGDKRLIRLAPKPNLTGRDKASIHYYALTGHA